MRDNPAIPTHKVALWSLRTRRRRTSRKLRKTTSAIHRTPTIPVLSRQPSPAPRSSTHPVMNTAPAVTTPSSTRRSNTCRPVPASAATTRPAIPRPTVSVTPMITTEPRNDRASPPDAGG
ncbi:hypothetical protein SGLAM104S_05715 [Streptomyces glaucescens]